MSDTSSAGRRRRRSEMRVLNEPEPASAQPLSSVSAQSLRSTQGYADEASDRSLEAILTRITETLQPSDTLEMMLVEDIAFLVWEAQQLRRARGQLIKAQMVGVLSERQRRSNEAATFGIVLDTPASVADRAAEAYVRYGRTDGLTGAAADVEREALEATAYSRVLDDLLKIEAMLAKIEQRRDAALDRLERRRAHERLQRVAER